MSKESKARILKNKRKNEAKAKVMAHKRRLKIKTKKEELNYPNRNAELIGMFMRSSKVKGSYKDYVLITQGRLIDWERSLDCVAEDGKPVSTNGTALVHKRNLKNFLSADVAAMFWHPVIGRQRMFKHSPSQPRWEAGDNDATT